MTTTRRILIGTALVAALADFASPAEPSLLIGGTASHGLGEERLAPYLEARLDSGPWRFSGQGELSRKVGGGGYRAGFDLERALGPFILTGAYRYRDGGSWTKQGAWGGIGVGTPDVRLVLRHEAGGNQTRSATATLGLGPVEWQGAVYQYRPTFGGKRQVGATVLLALRIQK
jgi:hypothetical protein